MKKYYHNVQRVNKSEKISEILNKVTKKITNKFGRLEYVIYSRWKEIVGDFFYKHSEPGKVNIIKTRNEEHNDSYQGVLQIKTTSAAALELQHYKDVVIERINSYCGYKAITQIKILQVPHISNKEEVNSKRKQRISLEKNDSVILEKFTSNIGSKKLKKTLLKLGKSALSEKNN